MDPSMFSALRRFRSTTPDFFDPPDSTVHPNADLISNSIFRTMFTLDREVKLLIGYHSRCEKSLKH